MIPVKEFFGAGRATFTVEVPGGFRESHDGVNPHYTYKVEYAEPNGQWPEAWFVKMLVGSDNTTDYRTIGMLNPETGQFRLTRKSNLNDKSWAVRLLRRVLANVYGETPDKITDAGFDVHHEGRCGRCGRKLTVPSSIKTGLGPVCFAKS
jgi:hypothetical protein